MGFLFFLLIIFFLIWFILKNFEIIAFILFLMALSIPAIEDKPKWYRSFYKSFFIGITLSSLYMLILIGLIKNYQISISETMYFLIWLSAFIILSASFIIFGIKDNKKRTLQRLNQEVRRREKIIRIFPNQTSANRLIGAVLMDLHDEWIYSSRKYINFDK